MSLEQIETKLKLALKEDFSEINWHEREWKWWMKRWG